MRARVIWLILAAVGLSACAVSHSSPQPVWQTGFWHWSQWGESAMWHGDPLDVLFVHAGDIREPEGPHKPSLLVDTWPGLEKSLPPAKEYWLVFRHQSRLQPDAGIAPELAKTYADVLLDARKKMLNVAGIQLDIDWPTGSLGRYAPLLRALRKELPPHTQISITTLLDWFEDREIDDVIRETDEFVPQFYDEAVGGLESVEIASHIDAAKWGPIFNKFGKRFRIGIATFGRARGDRGYSNDLRPVDFGANPDFQLTTHRTRGNDIVLTYRATRKTSAGDFDYNPGSTFEFVMATPEGVRDAVNRARQMKGQVAGVVFFRWPQENEALTMSPQEALAAAGLSDRGSQPDTQIYRIDGRCAAVECSDLYLESLHTLSPQPIHYRIHSSTPLEYILPEKPLTARMTGPAQIDLTLPAYCGRGRLLVGRAVTQKHADYTVEELQ